MEIFAMCVGLGIAVVIVVVGVNAICSIGAEIEPERWSGQ